MSYEFSSVEIPVVAIAENVGPSIVGVKVNYVSQDIFGSLSEADEEGSGIIYKEDGYIKHQIYTDREANTENRAIFGYDDTSMSVMYEIKGVW